MKSIILVVSLVFNVCVSGFLKGNGAGMDLGDSRGKRATRRNGRMKNSGQGAMYEGRMKKEYHVFSSIAMKGNGRNIGITKAFRAEPFFASSISFRLPLDYNKITSTLALSKFTLFHKHNHHFGLYC